MGKLLDLMANSIKLKCKVSNNIRAPSKTSDWTENTT